MLTVIYAKCYYAECRYTECRGAVCGANEGKKIKRHKIAVNLLLVFE
jgi:hypothetical protein